MMGFQPVVLWTDLLLFGLVGCIALAAWSARRSEPMRAAWGRVGASGVGMTSLTLLLIFVLVGLVDSLHYRERLAPAGAAQPGWLNRSISAPQAASFLSRCSKPRSRW